MTGRTGGLADFARAWTRVVAGTSYVPMTWDERERFLYRLAERLAGALLAEVIDPAVAYRVGVDLAEADFDAP
jgi:diguanylate cyclase